MAEPIERAVDALDGLLGGLCEWALGKAEDIKAKREHEEEINESNREDDQQDA